MRFSRILAKRSANPDAPELRETLPGHLDDVVSAAEAILRHSAPMFRETFRLDDAGLASLAGAVPRAAFLHDLGKANDHFQAMMRGGREGQAIRHEQLSGWLGVPGNPVGDWLFAGCDPTIRNAALLAVIGHHLKPDATPAGPLGRPIRLHLSHADVRSACAAFAARHAFRAPDDFRDQEFDPLENDRPPELIRWSVRDGLPWFRALDPSGRLFVAILKGVLFAADAAGSAVPVRGSDPAKWCADTLSRIACADELEDVARRRLNGRSPRPFQARVAATDAGIAFVKAGCGSGKTVAAYLWAARRAAGRKVWVCYPTTGTATEGFHDYVIPSELGSDAALLHSRAECDLERILTDDDERRDDDGLRIASLAAWDAPLAVVTVDRVLGLLHNARAPLYSFPALAAGAFVFDEIHQYDERLFRGLLRFLEVFHGAPTLLMTASLPLARREALEGLARDTGRSFETIGGPPDLESRPRYRFLPEIGADPWPHVTETLGAGGHSRYRYADRLDRHSDVLEAFRTPGPALALTTQVCEVSLDLSADLLVTDLAPIPALIQRLGRLHRNPAPGEENLAKPALFLVPGTPLPYEAARLDAARTWIGTLGTGALSQRDLAAAFERFDERMDLARLESVWIDGFRTDQTPPRDSEGSVTVIRSEDRAACRSASGRLLMKEIVRHSIPMTVHQVLKEITGWERLGGAVVAPSGRIVYDSRWGAEWRK